MKCNFCNGPIIPTEHQFIQSQLGYLHKDKEVCNIYLQDYGKAKRNTTPFRYDILDPEFLEVMAKIGHYGSEEYGDLNWTKSRLVGDKGPINHIYKHLGQYRRNRPYDHKEIGEEKKIHLAAIAFNAMMEYFYECHPEMFKDN